MEYREHTLPLPQAIHFFSAIRDEDSFTILWELAAHSPKPLPFETIRKTFGAEPRYLLEVLNRLHHLGVATKAGRQWTVTYWAKSNLEYLEELMKDVQIEVAQPASPIMQMYANDAVTVATLDGFWTAATSQVTGQDRSGVPTPPTASAKGAVELNPSELTNKPQNEARSHDYK